jgi:hypothetical protein
VGLERGPLSLVSTTEDLLGRKSSSSNLEIREYGHRNPLHWPHETLYPQKLPLTSPTSGGHSVGIVHLRTKAMELLYCPDRLWGSFKGKAEGAGSWPLTSDWCWGKENVDLCIHSPICLHGIEFS